MWSNVHPSLIKRGCESVCSLIFYTFALIEQHYCYESYQIAQPFVCAPGAKVCGCGCRRGGGAAPGACAACGRSRATEWGRQHGYNAVRSYSDYVQAVGVTPYDELRPYVMRMIAGERDVLWRGVTRRFAQSSGTSDGKSKYIPVTAESLKRCHYRGATDSVALYLSCYDDSRILTASRLFSEAVMRMNLILSARAPRWATCRQP